MFSQSGTKRSHNGSVKYSSYNSSSSNMPSWSNGMNGGPQSMYGGNEGNTFWGDDDYCGNSNFGNSGMGLSGMSNNYTPFSKSGVLNRVGGYEESRGRGLLRSSQGNGGNSYMMQRSGLLNNDSFSMGRSGFSDGSFLSMGRSGSSGGPPFSMGRSSSSFGDPFSMRRPDPSSNFPMPKPLLECLPSYSGSSPFESDFGSMGPPQRFHSNKARSSFASSQRQNMSRQSSGRPVLSRVSKGDVGKGGGGGSKVRARIGKSGTKNKQKKAASTAAVPADIGSKSARPPFKRRRGVKQRLTKKDMDKEFSEELQADCPAEALYCHMCEIEVFSTTKNYVEHIFSEKHKLVAKLFHAKMAATLELLSTSAELAEAKVGAKPTRRRKRVKKQTERVLFNKMSSVGMCCGEKFASLFDLEEHKLTLSHLKKKYEINNRKGRRPFDTETEKEDSVMNNEGGASSAIPEIPNDVEGSIEEYYTLIDQAKEIHSKTPLTSANLPIYDASVMIGLQFIEKASTFVCSICRNHPFKAVRLHCQSFAHYNNIVKHIKKVEEMERKAKEALKSEQAEAAKEERVNPEGASVEISSDNIEISADNLEVMDSIDANGEEAEEVSTEIPSGEEKIETIIHDSNLEETDVLYEEFGEDLEEEDAHPIRRRSLRFAASEN